MPLTLIKNDLSIGGDKKLYGPRLVSVERTIARELGLPSRAVQAFHDHRRRARALGIPFLFGFLEWWEWWQVDGRWKRRGNGRPDSLVMARNGDVGPYSPENVRCVTQSENQTEIAAEKRLERALKTAKTRRNGDGYKNTPRSRAVVTPNGWFRSVAEAGRAHDICTTSAKERAQRGSFGWRYDEPTDQNGRALGRIDRSGLDKLGREEPQTRRR